MHILSKKNNIPNWFKFKSGIIDYEIMEVCESMPAKNPFFYNLITPEANRIVAEKIIKLSGSS